MKFAKHEFNINREIKGKEIENVSAGRLMGKRGGKLEGKKIISMKLA